MRPKEKFMKNLINTFVLQKTNNFLIIKDYELLSFI